LVLFLSDNGGSPRSYAVNTPLRGWKYNLYEGGIRVPFLACWPGSLPEGRTCDSVVSALDILPTLVSAAGGALPSKRRFDGRNILPLLKGEPSPAPRTLCWRKGRETDWAIRSGDWKLVSSKQGVELYNLADDVGETRNLAKTMPGQAKRLTERFRQWEQSVK
jgi:arylsulfatase A-like enzyme